MGINTGFGCDVTHEDPGPVCVLTLRGQLDQDAADGLDRVIEARLAAGDRRFVLDLGQLAYIGSLGLRALVRLHSRVKAEGGLCLADPTPHVQDVLKVTKLGRVLRLYTTRSEALAAVRTITGDGV